MCACLQNYVRVVEVWWDEYKDYFYASRPETLNLAYGDISELKKFRYIINTYNNKKMCLIVSMNLGICQLSRGLYTVNDSI